MKIVPIHYFIFATSATNDFHHLGHQRLDCQNQTVTQLKSEDVKSANSDASKLLINSLERVLQGKEPKALHFQVQMRLK